MSKESKLRRRLCSVLLAETVTSRDEGGHRRYKSALTGEWGYCLDDGTVVQEARFEYARHFFEELGIYIVRHRGKIKLFNKNWERLLLYNLDDSGEF